MMSRQSIIKLVITMIFMMLFTACGGGNGVTEVFNISSETEVNQAENQVRIIRKLQPADPLYVVYEDAEDGMSDRWTIYDKKPAGAVVTNVFDADKNSNVIDLNGTDTKNGYMLGYWSGSRAWNNHEDTILKWSMKFSEKFYIYIRLKTKNGSRDIVYRPENEDRGLTSDKYINIGLGEEVMDGTWQHFSRDIEADLKRYDTDNELIAVNAFLIKGSGRLDDIKMLKSSKEIYEDAEDSLTDGWLINDNTPEEASIENLYDNDRQSKIIALQGDGTKNRYTLGERTGENMWENRQYKVLKWSMNYAENFSVEIATETSVGYRLLRYTPTEEDGGLSGNTINLALGSHAKTGTWQTFVRDLEADLQKFEEATLVEVNAFAIRGSGKLDDIEMLKREKRSYADGADSSVWRIYDETPAGASISSVDDGHGNAVTKLVGDGTKNGYALGASSGSKAWYNRENKVLKWSMNYAEKYRISIPIDTLKGARYLVYEPLDIDKTMSGKNIYLGLGLLSQNGTWQTFARDLEADLKKYESDNEIVAVNGFFIKGSGLIDNVEMMHFSPILADNMAPVITLNGHNPTRLLVGESYIDAGAVITDDRDSNINVSVENSVNVNEAGEYEVSYTATDSVSNISKKVRTVIVFAEDTEAPSIELLGGNPMYITKGDDYIEDGAVATDNVDDSVEVLITGSVDADREGDYILTYTATDRFGNSANKIRKVTVEPKRDSKYNLEYLGLSFYEQSLPKSSYRLNQLDNSEFNALSKENQLIVADKLLSTLFFGYAANELDEKIASGNFINEVRNALEEQQTDKVALENEILDDEKYYQSTSLEPMVKILSRFVEMKNLDAYLFDNWMAYTLTQTIMFSPAYELETTEVPNVSRVYNGLVNSIENDEGIRFITYQHMMSEDNWRRFRSPEDNGREMLEIFMLDGDDSHVPLAAKALQNWRLSPESNTLVVELNQNIEPINLFGTTLFTGLDFYRELVKSDGFIRGITSRIVDAFFFNSTRETKESIVSSIVASSPETWDDIFKQIIFSEAYLLQSNRAKKAEENFFSLSRKLNYQPYYKTAYDFRSALEKMHQASMKYKLGRLDPVPLDTLSFANYHKYIREKLLTKMTDIQYENEHKKWSRQGWHPDFVSFDKFHYEKNEPVESLDSLITLIFKSTVARGPEEKELVLFHEFMIQDEKFPWQFNMFVEYEEPNKQEERRERAKNYITRVVLEYISRLQETYQYKEVK